MSLHLLQANTEQNQHLGREKELKKKTNQTKPKQQQKQKGN